MQDGVGRKGRAPHLILARTRGENSLPLSSKTLESPSLAPSFDQVGHRWGKLGCTHARAPCCTAGQILPGAELSVTTQRPPWSFLCLSHNATRQPKPSAPAPRTPAPHWHPQSQPHHHGLPAPNLHTQRGPCSRSKAHPRAGEAGARGNWLPTDAIAFTP